MRRILSQTRKELTQLIRDRRALGLALFLPVMQLMLMGSAISLTVSDLPIAVQDLDGSPTSRSLIDAFRQSDTFRIVPFAADKQPESAFVDNKARAALIIPARFGHDIARGGRTPVQLLIDASDSNTAKLLRGYASEVTAAWNSQNGGGATVAPVTAVIRFWYNPGRSSKKFYGPGIFVLVMSLFPPLLATLASAKEGEQKTILQVYVSNISAHEFLLGKIFSFMIVCFCECLLLLTLLFTYFGLSFAGDPTPFIVATVFYAFCVASFGTMIGCAIPSQVAAMSVIMFAGFLLVFMLSGLIFPLQNVPGQIRWLSNFIWGRYYIEVVRDALLQGGGWPAQWWKVLIIGVTGFFFYWRGWMNMRRMQLKS
ncbi:MAG TPA: ABC transporter permease [Bryobacteraceae bacterium]|jgi:ABC-2 type transport system permease protein|nr:ABC transporter permease [Bryobacteraceae bacterium]